MRYCRYFYEPTAPPSPHYRRLIYKIEILRYVKSALMRPFGIAKNLDPDAAKRLSNF